MKKENTFSTLAFCFFLLIYLPCEVLSQNSTNRGKDFWVGFMGHIDGAASNFKLYLTSDVNTSGTIAIPLQGWSVPFSVSANTITIVQIPSAVAYVGCSDCTTQNGIHIVSDDNVAVYAHIFNNARSDATLVLPTLANGVEYYAMCFTQSTDLGLSEFLVVATEDSTQVEITPVANTQGGNPANIPFTVNLQQGETYQVQASLDLSGSKILSVNNGSNSCKRIAVFSGSSWTRLGCSNAGTGDNLFEQMYPANKWGKNFITSPLKSRVGDMFRVMALSNGTTVTINGVPHLLNQAQYFDTLLSVPAYYSSNNAITLAQYARSQSCDHKVGDPFMIILSPLEQTVNNILLYCSPQQNIVSEYINIVMKTADVGSFLLDGSAVFFTPVPSKPDYSYSRNTVTAGTHSIVADSGFNAIAYGFGDVESYGYLAGTNVKNFQQQSFTVNLNSACIGSTINFTGAASYVPVSWKWDFGDSTSSSSPTTTTHIYTNAGTFLVSLVTTYYNGCVLEQDSTSRVIHINNPSANFTSSTGCLVDTMLFVDGSTVPAGDTINSWLWDFGDGTNSITQNSTHTYATSGTCDTFIVKLVVSSNIGCKDSTTKTVAVKCVPTANFSASAACKGQATIFNDSGTGNISAWNWTFGDGSPVNTTQNPSHVYANAGTYTVTLIVNNSSGCADTVTKPVQVYYSPTAGFTQSDVCQGNSLNFSNTSSIDPSTSITGYLWTFGDGSTSSILTSPSHFYSNAGAYTVTLVATTVDGCSNADSVTVNVYDAPVAAFTFNNTCVPDSAVFTNTSINPTSGTIANWSWDFGDGSPLNTTAWSPHHLYALAGNYQVTLITYSSTLGCADTLKSTITVFPMPTANFSFADVCLNQVMNFYDSSTIAGSTVNSWLWDFGDGNNSITPNTGHTYATCNTFSAKLVVSSNNGCKDSTTKTVAVKCVPTANFSANPVCKGQTMLFNDSGIGNISAWNWSFGDGSPVNTTQNPSHVYANAGNYTVTLIVSNSLGCADTITKAVQVYYNPTAGFTHGDVCLGDSMSFTNTSSIDPSTSITSYLWAFSDGSPNSIFISPSYFYSNPGTYTVTLIATSADGCSDADSVTVNVYDAPIAAFTFSNTCAFDSAVFTNTSVNPTIGTIANWSWDFGDGSPLNTTVWSPHHLYALAGNYPVTLITNSSTLGCADTLKATITVFPMPTANFGFADVCLSQEMNFNDSSTIAGSTIAGWLWNFGDGTNSIAQNIGHTYATCDTFSVKLVVSSTMGCKDSTTKAVTVNCLTTANFNVAPVCKGQSTQFNGSGTGNISAWNWSFGDGSPVNTTQNPSHVYTNAGNYTVTLIVNNSLGCVDTIIKQVQVYYPPSADFTHSDVCLGDSMSFTNTSSIDPSTSITGYLWVFSDSSSNSIFASPTHFYSNAGTYNVTLITTTANGCSDAKSGNVNVYDAPATSFTFSNTCLFDSVVFTNTSVNPTIGTIANWSWDFGDSAPLNTTVWSPHHLYAPAGNYPVTLITHSSTLGCADTLKSTITVFPVPTANFGFADVCLNQGMNFHDSSTVAGSTIAGWSWNFGDSSQLNSTQNPNYTYTNAGSYPVMLIAATNNGCKDTLVKNVVVHPLPYPQFTFSNVCDGDSVHFNNSSVIPSTDTIQFCLWNFFDGSPINICQHATHLYVGAGTYTVRLVDISNFGCIDSLSKTVVVNPNPVVNFTANDTAACNPLCTTFQNLSSVVTGTNVQWLWNLGDSSAQSTIQNPSHCYINDSVFAPAVYPVSLTVTSDSGCVSTLTKNNYITVYPLPVASFTVQPETATNTNPVISFMNESTGAHFWNWNFGDGSTPLATGTDSSNFVNPFSHTYADTGTYLITLVTSTLYNCLDTAYQNITIEPDFVFYIPSAFSPNGNNINETFQGVGIGIKEYDMTIFDRWGNKIFKTKDYNLPWDGKANDGNKIAEQDVYIYVIVVTDFKKRKHNYKGIVTLVR